MFFHNFKYSLKVLFRNRLLIFWTFAFPIILGTFFKMAFSNIESSEQLDIIDIAVVENDAFIDNDIYKQIFKELSKGDEQLFEIAYVKSTEEAENLLKDKDVCGYLLLDKTPQVVIGSNGINETVFEFVVEKIEEKSAIIEKLLQKRLSSLPPLILQDEVSMGQFYSKFFKEVSASIERETTGIVDESKANMSYTMIEFYTLIAMACLYGGILGMYALNQRLPDMSNKGKRVSVSPMSKGSLVLSTVLASFVVQMIGVLLLFVYTIFALKVDYGNNLLHIIMLAFVGSLAGLSLGVMIASLFRAKEDTKIGLVVAITMFGSFLSGMMGITMKYIVDKNVPFVNMINPANMITDGFYSLYYYGVDKRFYFDMASLLIFSLVMAVLAILALRRKQYDSI